MSICLIDTSIFVEVLDVPNMNEEHDKIIQDLMYYADNGCIFLLPLTTIIETGNHIAQNGNGNQRRNCALKFVEQVKAAFSGEAPWQPTNIASIEDLMSWIDEFPELAKANKTPDKYEGTSLGDMLIIEEWKKICKQNPHREVFIWTKDRDLSCYRQEAR